MPVVVDLAAMREALVTMGGKAGQVNPQCPLDLVIDHSVMVDTFGTKAAFSENVRLEFERNTERYAFLKWGQQLARSNFRAVPPGTGICHQVNLEYLGQAVFEGADGSLYPDTLVGTDSHTTMINGLGVVGWGVGGIEAEAAMLGQPITMLIPQVIGFRLDGPPVARRDRHRPGAHRHPDAAEEGRGGEVRRVLRPRRREPPADRPRHRGQHGARVRRHHRLLPHRRGDASNYLRLHRPLAGARRPASRPTAKEQGLWSAPDSAEPRLHRHPRARPLQGRALPRRPGAPAGPGAALADMKASFPRHVERSVLTRAADGDPKLAAKAEVTARPRSATS